MFLAERDTHAACSPDAGRMSEGPVM